MRRPRRQQLLFAIDQIRCVERGQLESMAMRDRICRTGFHAIAAKDAAIVVNVVNLGVAFSPADSLFLCILRRLNVDTIRRAVRRAEEAGYALLQAIFVPLQNVYTAIPLLNLCPPQRSWTIRIVLHRR